MSNSSDTSNHLIEQWSDFLQGVLKQESGWTQVVFIAALSVIFVIGLIGNLLTCIVIYYDRTMHTATNYYLFNLAMSDLFVSFAIFLEIYYDISVTYHFSEVFCKVHFFLVVALWNNSILIMTALAIERYIAIWYPLMLNSTPVWRRVVKVIVLIWIVALLEALPELWSVKLVQTQKSSICFTVPTKFARVMNGVQALLTFVVPLGLMTFVYVMIVFKVNVTAMTSSRDKIFNHQDNRSKVNKLIGYLSLLWCSAALTLSFLVCWLPFFTLRVLTSACDMHQLMRLPEWWGFGFKLVSFNSWFSIVLNPLLFSLMSIKFRKALKALWKAKFKRRDSHSYVTSRIYMV